MTGKVFQSCPEADAELVKLLAEAEPISPAEYQHGSAGALQRELVALADRWDARAAALRGERPRSRRWGKRQAERYAMAQGLSDAAAGLRSLLSVGS